MPPATVEQLLHHPLFGVMIEGESPRLSCFADVPGLEQFRIVRPVVREEITLDQALELMAYTGANLLRWLTRRGVSVHRPECVLMDLENRELYTIDMVGERGDELTLILVYFSPRRGGPAWDAMVAHGEAVRRLLDRQYHLQGEVVVINLYGGALVRGAWVPSS